MKLLRTNALRFVLVNLALSTASILILATPVCAQSRGVPRESEAERNERLLAEREWLLRSIGKGTKKDIDVQPQRLTLGQVKEDYEGIQVANNNILRMIASGKELDQKIITSATADIKKRASRLKSFLIALERAEEDKDRKKDLTELEPARLKSSLLVLDASIVRLVENPIFRHIDKVVDVESSKKALSELDSIIELSEKIKRSVERSTKTARVSQ
ncbi:MAG TPA: hypothetical protein VGC66_04250 [Pyrinomonadaceae bacterium]|jgi:hypothetical protein